MTQKPAQPFSNPSVLQEAHAILMGMRDADSLDAFYAQMMIPSDDVPAILREEAEAKRFGLSLIPDPQTGMTRLWREILAEPDWDHAHDPRPHRYWSTSPGEAHAHWGEGEEHSVRWLIEGEIHWSFVDEARTLALATNPITSPEGEIALIQGANPRIIDARPRPRDWKHAIF